MKKLPSFQYKACIACGICFSFCPVSAITLSAIGADKGIEAFPEVVSVDQCIGCEICAKSCPMDAIEMVERQG